MRACVRVRVHARACVRACCVRVCGGGGRQEGGKDRYRWVVKSGQKVSLFRWNPLKKVVRPDQVVKSLGVSSGQAFSVVKLAPAVKPCRVARGQKQLGWAGRKLTRQSGQTFSGGQIWSLAKPSPHRSNNLAGRVGLGHAVGRGLIGPAGSDRPGLVGRGLIGPVGPVGRGLMAGWRRLPQRPHAPATVPTCE